MDENNTTKSDGDAAENQTAAGTPDHAEELKAAAEKARKDYLYLLAEFDNYKKQVIKERADIRKYGSERLIVELLNSLDLLETALATPVTPETIEKFKAGIEMTAKELRNTFQKFGVEELPAHGKPFDPSSHEALSSEETDTVPSGHISHVFKKPYKLHDRVIRPGQVVVAKDKA
jgi:molecular chaperone GrpE